MSQTQQFVLKKEEELRFEVNWNANVKLKLIDGTAEIFGTELAMHREYNFSACKLAVFTWHGCKLELSGEPEHAYVASETPMASYAAIHDMLEKERERAAMTGETGPRVMVVGPTDSGKSSLCKILTNYAVRMQHKVFYCDIDVGQSAISIPGTIACLQVDEPINVEEGFSLTSPLCYFYGHASPSDNADLYKKLVERVAEVFTLLSQKDARVKATGMIVNTCGWVEGLGYSLLLHAAKAMNINHILVMGDERLVATLNSSLTKEKLNDRFQVHKMQKSGGVVTRDSAYRRKARMEKIKEYFYGPRGNLCPHSIVVNLDEVTICKIGGGAKAPKSALPIGAESTINPLKVSDVPVNMQLMHSVLGVSHAKSKDELLTANIAGVVYVSNIDTEKNQMTLLAPSPGKLPSRFLLSGSLKWLDQS